MFHQKPKPGKIIRFLIKPIDFQFLNQISDFEFWIGFVGFCKTDPDRFLGYADFSFPECHMNYLEKTICLLGIWSPQVFLSKYVNNNFHKLPQAQAQYEKALSYHRGERGRMMLRGGGTGTSIQAWGSAAGLVRWDGAQVMRRSQAKTYDGTLISGQRVPTTGSGGNASGGKGQRALLAFSRYRALYTQQKQIL
jgi:hypothetical protein